MSSKIVALATRIMAMAIVISMILLFVGIGVLILIHFCIVRRAFMRGFGDSAAVQRDCNGSTSMAQDNLQNLPCYDYIARSNRSSPVDCAVCLDNFKMGDKCRLLPICRHSFHSQCVDAWLLKNSNCPICRTRVSLGKDGLAAGEDSSRFSGVSIDLRENQTGRSADFNDARLEMTDTHLSGIGTQLVESQTNVDEPQLGSSPAPLPDPALEPAV